MRPTRWLFPSDDTIIAYSIFVFVCYETFLRNGALKYKAIIISKHAFARLCCNLKYNLTSEPFSSRHNYRAIQIIRRQQVLHGLGES